MYYDYSKLLEYTWRIPTTYAPYGESDKWRPFCIIHHTCPSGYAWVKFIHEEKRHLCRVHTVIRSAKMEAVSVGPFEIGVAYSHIDRTRKPYESRCGLPLTGREPIQDISIGGDRPECCLDCWNRRV